MLCSVHIYTTQNIYAQNIALNIPISHICHFLTAA